MWRRRLALVAGVLMIMAGGTAAVVGIRSLNAAQMTTNPASFKKPQPATRTELGRDANDRRYLEILGAGDVLAHPELWHQAIQDGHGQPDFYPMFSHAAPTIAAADLAICHLETPLAPADGPFDGFPRFSVPQQIVGGIKRAGFDACSTASNHALDQGEEGVVRTLEELDRQGIGHSGTYRTQSAAMTPVIYDVKGVKVGHLSYTKHFNGLTPPDGKPWIANPIDVTAIRYAATSMKAAGAKIVILSMHWGTEYQHEPDSDQQIWAQEVIAVPGIDVVLGHHAHVVQPVENINGKVGHLRDGQPDCSPS